MHRFTYLSFALGLLATYRTAANTAPSSLAQPSNQTEPPSSHTAKTSDVKTEHIIYPKNGTDEDAISKTEANIKSITQISNLLPYRDVNNELRMWLVNVTNTQLSAIQEDDGVGLTEENIIAMKTCHHLPQSNYPI